MEQGQPPTGPKGQGAFNSFLKYSSFGLQLLGGIGLAGWAGHGLDVYLKFTFPIFLLSFTLIVLTGMLYQMNKQFNQD